MGLLHVLTYVFVFTAGGAIVDLLRIAVRLAARRRTARKLGLPRTAGFQQLAGEQIEAERAKYMEAAHREVAEMFWETSSLGRPAPSEAARIEHRVVTGCSNTACLGGHAPNEAAVPEPRGYGPIEISFGERRAAERAAQAPGPVIIDGHTLPSSDDERWELSGKDRIWFWFRTEGFGLAVYDDGRVWLDSKEWFVHKDAAALFRKVRDRIGPIQKAKAVAAVEAAARKRP